MIPPEIGCTQDSSPQLSGQSKVTKIERIAFFMAMIVYLIGCIAEFIFLTQQFGLKPAFVLSLISALPLAIAFYMWHRWNSIRKTSFDWLSLALVVTVAATAWTCTENIKRSYNHNVHHGAQWTFFRPRDPGEVSWEKFGQELRKDPAFQNVKVVLTERKHIHYVSGTLKSESDLDRLKALAQKCGIFPRDLDGPYAHSISITIPGTTRATRYETPD